MRMSKSFGRTLWETPADTEMASHALLVRAGMIRPLISGVYTYLPLGWRVIRRIEQIIREEMDAIGGQEMLMPTLLPAELWRTSGRWDHVGPELVRLRDRAHRDLILAMTHEEVVADLARREISSYRQLPALLYQFQTKIRDEERPRGGLLRVREFIMKDAYSLDTDWAGLEAFYPKIYQAYVNVFTRCGLEPLAVEADPGMMGGTGSHEFMLVNEHGEDTVVVCPAGDYAANVENATTTWETDQSEMLPMEEVETPGVDTIAGLAEYLGIPESQTAKAMFYTTGDDLIFAVIRGDLEINETKLARALRTDRFEAASDEAIRAAGAVPGYASPLGLLGQATILVDPSVVAARNLVAGANKEGYHVRNVNYGRDYTAHQVVDLAVVREGDACPRCSAPLVVHRAIELGHIFKLGTKYSEALGAVFLDATGEARPIVMGSYGIGLGRLMAAIAEVYHDSHGLIWPPAVAPYDVHLVGLFLDRPEVAELAERTYHALQAQGFAILFDDRDERPGVKFNDADLIGVPVRVTISPRALEKGSAEVKARWDTETRVVSFEALAGLIQEILIHGERLPSG